MSEQRIERALAHLAKAGAVLAQSRDGVFGAYPRGDRRRRPVARLNADEVKALESEGVIIARDRSYHGSTHLAMAMSGDARTRAQVDPDAFGVSHVAPPYAYRCPFGSGGPTECGERAAAAVGERIEVFNVLGAGDAAHGEQLASAAREVVGVREVRRDGTTIRVIPSSAATARPCSGPPPPKGSRVRPRGS